MTHSPGMLGNEWLGELKSHMEQAGQVGEGTQAFVGIVDMPVKYHHNIPHAVTGENHADRAEMCLSIVALGDTVVFDIWSAADEPWQRIGNLLLNTHGESGVEAEGLPRSAESYTLQLNLATGEGSFAADRPGPEIPAYRGRSRVETQFNVNSLTLSPAKNTVTKRQAAFALRVARHWSDLAIATRAG